LENAFALGYWVAREIRDRKVKPRRNLDGKTLYFGRQRDNKNP
jgi:hypothetical protein